MFSFPHNKTIKRLLVMRFSAMGDAAMTVPVLYALATQHPELRITMLTRTRFVPMFEWLPANVLVRGIDFTEQDGIIGLTKIYNRLKKGNFDAVADLHDVLRSKYIRTCFAMAGTKVATVDKGRKEKKELIGEGQTHAALKPMTERYAEVFRALGFPIDLTKPVKIDLRNEDFLPIRNGVGRKQEGEKWVGVAPFAAHAQKIYPLDKMQQVVNALADKGYKVLLFGAGKKEGDILKTWENPQLSTVNSQLSTLNSQLSTIQSVCGKLGGLKNEMLLMSQLDLMISMDSANMHIASIFGIPTLSIWGATHPKAGFSGYGQKAENELQTDLSCRPCSIYGKKPCKWGDLRCMNIPPETVVEKAIRLLESGTRDKGQEDTQ